MATEYKKILLTGGTGFFGSALLNHLNKLPAVQLGLLKVDVLSRDPGSFLIRCPEFAHRPWLSFVRGDIEDPVCLPHGNSYSHVLHAAADSTLGPTLSAAQRRRQIVDGTTHILEFAHTTGARRFLYASSGAVYAPRAPGVLHISEAAPLVSPEDTADGGYGASKVRAEQLCAEFCRAHGIELVIARCFAFVGPDLPLNVHFAIGNFIRDALYGDAITVQGDGSPVRSYMHQDDLARLLLALLLGKTAHAIYNVGSDQAISIRDLAHLVRDQLAPGKPVNILGVAQSGSPRNTYVPNIDRARSDLGFDLARDLMTALQSTRRDLVDRAAPRHVH
jgi:dTDP-glucose 4,6-dehydratase